MPQLGMVRMFVILFLIGFIAACGDGGNNENNNNTSFLEFCDGPTINGSCQFSQVLVPDLEIYCSDENGDPNCPSVGQQYYGQDGNFSINTESYALETVGGSRLIESISGLTWATTAYPAETLALAQGQCETLSSENYGGISNWRVPSIRELTRIISKRGANNMWPINMENPANSFWWSQTPNFSVPGNYIGMSGNWPWTISHVGFSGARYTFCVSGPEMAGAWRVNSDEVTVTHTVTNLMWERSPNDRLINWYTALNYCLNSTTGGYTDWRLPTLREYFSVLDLQNGTSYMSAAFNNIMNEQMLTSTPVNGSSIAYINEGNAISYQEDVVTLDGYARCVRGPI